MLIGKSNHVAFFPVDYSSSGNLTPRITLPSIYALEATRRALYEYLAIAKDYFFAK
jgi:hypothetical protein